MTPSKPEPSAAIDAANALTAGMAALATDIRDLQIRGHRYRRLLKWLAASVLLDIALSLGLGYVAWQSHNAANKAERATSAAALLANNNRATCLAANKGKSDQRALWDKIFTFPPPAHETAEARTTREKQSAEFKTFLDGVFDPEKC